MKTDIIAISGYEDEYLFECAIKENIGIAKEDGWHVRDIKYSTCVDTDSIGDGPNIVNSAIIIYEKK